MQRCLHDPKRGYYSRNIRSIGGTRGDFTTAPQLSNLPAKAISAWITRAMKSCRTHNLIEVGPGIGTLSQQVLEFLPPLLRYRTKLHLVESSPTLAKIQKDTLGSKATIHADIHSALHHCKGNAIIFSNELVDAFPVRVFQYTNHQWLELNLQHTPNTHPSEILIQPDSLPNSTAFSSNFPNNQRIEIHESYKIWLESWLPIWKRGKMLTIDYGNTIDQLYFRRPNGTIRAYLLHQVLTGQQIYQNPGLQDITADVNFSDLRNWSAPWLTRGESFSLSDLILPFLSSPDSQLLQACNHFFCLDQTKYP